MFNGIKPTVDEVAAPLAGDNIVPNAEVIMDRAFTLPGMPDEVWPWFMQLGKNRSGWYFPSLVERFIPKTKRGINYIEPKLQNLIVGKIIDDWGGRDATFEVAILEPPHVLVHQSKRGNTYVSWAIILKSQTNATTRVQLRLRLAPVKHKWLADSVGNLVDALTVAGLAVGLQQRLVSYKRKGTIE